jgi:hypothetical protein
MEEAVYWYAIYDLKGRGNTQKLMVNEEKSRRCGAEIHWLEMYKPCIYVPEWFRAPSVKTTSS